MGLVDQNETLYVYPEISPEVLVGGKNHPITPPFINFWIGSIFAQVKYGIVIGPSGSTTTGTSPNFCRRP